MQFPDGNRFHVSQCDTFQAGLSNRKPQPGRAVPGGQFSAEPIALARRLGPVGPGWPARIVNNLCAAGLEPATPWRPVPRQYAVTSGAGGVGDNWGQKWTSFNNFPFLQAAGGAILGLLRQKTKLPRRPARSSGTRALPVPRSE